MTQQDICRICGEDAQYEDPYGAPVCKECSDRYTSCCGYWLEHSETGLCPECKEHCL